ncbi:MAG: GNAT family N-acetyltransferase [Lachnospiraceae bacterium]|nr:GNAT family N-acetyltransferase [Lachnospiraceae bacterium]
MTNQQILQIAMKQSALDSNCDWQDFQGRKNKVVISAGNENARKYLELPFLCDLASYGSNIVASVSEELVEIVTRYINRFPIEHCFETPNLHELMKEIRPLGYDVCFMAEYSLPDVDVLLEGGLADRLQKNCPYEIRLMEPDDFQDCYTEEWSNALCENRREWDVIAAGAYADGRLIGLAGASADCASMWQIGIDVLPEYRREGIAATLTSRLAVEILNRDIVPFYCCAWSNVGSIRNAIASGFRPAWVQLTVKKLDKIAEMNK